MSDVLPPWPLRFGAFIAPFHPTGQNPTYALQRDLELIELLDQIAADKDNAIGTRPKGCGTVVRGEERMCTRSSSKRRRA